MTADGRTIRLTKRQREIMDGAARDESGPETARRLGIDYETLKTHRRYAKDECGVRSLPAAVAILVDSGIIKP